MSLFGRSIVFFAATAGILQAYLFWSDGYRLERGSIGVLALYLLFGCAGMIWLRQRDDESESSGDASPIRDERAYDESGKPKRPPEVISMSNRIFSILSHEIRTPVTAIASSTQVLKQGLEKLSDERRENHFRNIQVAIERIQSLIDGVTLVTQSEQGKLPYLPRGIDLLSFCEATMDQLEGHSESRRIQLDFDEQLPSTLSLDEGLLRHLLYNLLSNALKYSESDTPVEFVVKRQGDFLEFVIRDQGIGIPAEDHGQLFESFHRASNVSAIPGTGLGLNIAKRAVEAHGGTISYESVEGVGSTFMVCLPLA